LIKKGAATKFQLKRGLTPQKRGEEKMAIQKYYKINALNLSESIPKLRR